MNYNEAAAKRNWYIAIGAVDARIDIAVFGNTAEQHVYTVTAIWN